MDADTFRQIALYPATYREHVLIDCDGVPKPLASVMDPWQAADFVAMDASWRRVSGQQTESGPTRFWCERPRGHSKSLDLGVMAAWCLTFSGRRLSAIAAAADRDQSRLLRDAIGRLRLMNPWLEVLEVQANRIVNRKTGSTLEFITSDAPSSYGALIDFAIVDEVCHWRDRALFDSILSAAAKRSHCLLACISNAGWLDGWAYKVREAIRTDQSWRFSRLNGPVASWITADRLSEQQRLLPDFQYRRLWLNEWVTGSDSPLIGTADLDRSVCIEEPTCFPRGEGPYCGGLDLATRKDNSALVVIGENVLGPRLRLAAVREWSPRQYGGEVPLSIVESEILQLAHRMPGKLTIAFDPFQAELLAQRLSTHEDKIAMYRFPWSSLNKHRMALAAIESFRFRRVDLYPHEGLLRDLRRTSIVERAGRIGFELPRDEYGHGDVGSAFLMANYWARITRADYLGEHDLEGYANVDVA